MNNQKPYNKKLKFGIQDQSKIFIINNKNENTQQKWKKFNPK